MDLFSLEEEGYEQMFLTQNVASVNEDESGPNFDVISENSELQNLGSQSESNVNGTQYSDISDDEMDFMCSSQDQQKQMEEDKK